MHWWDNRWRVIFGFRGSAGFDGASVLKVFFGSPVMDDNIPWSKSRSIPVQWTGPYIGAFLIRRLYPSQKNHPQFVETPLTHEYLEMALAPQVFGQIYLPLRSF